MKYRPIIDLRIRHAYYADGRCADFTGAPSAETQRLLAGCRCLVRAFPDGFQVSTATTDDGQPFLPLPPGKLLTFSLRLANADFPLFTDLAAFAGQPAPLFTTVGADQPVAAGGQTPPQALRLASATAAQTESLLFPAGAASARFTLGGQPFGNVTAAGYTLAGLGGAATVTTGATGRDITVAAPGSPAARPFTVSYPVLPPRSPGVFAQIEIVVARPTGTTAALHAYEIHFTSLAARWRYYLVSPPASAREYAVDFGQTAAFDPATPDDADLVGLALATQYGAAARVDCFTSRTPLPSGEAAPAGLRLMKGTDAEALPAPAPRNLFSLGDSAPAFYRILRKT